MVCPKARETPLASPFNSVCHMSRPDFGNQEYVFTQTRNDISDQFLRIAISGYLGRIDQRLASEIPSRSASSSTGSGCRPWPKRAEP